MIDNSQVISYRNCPTQYRFKYILGLEKIQEGETEHDRNFGKAIHGGLDYWYQGHKAEVCIERFKELYPHQQDESDLAKTQENGLLLLTKYFHRYQDDFDKYEILGVEEKIEFELGGKEYCVKCDTVVRNKKFGSVYGLEHKTTGKSLTYDYWSRFDPNSQLNSQTAGIKAKYRECSGIIVNSMSFGHRKKAYKGEPAGFHCDFGRMEFNLNESSMNLWERSASKTIKDIGSDVESDQWAMNTDSCRFCSFKPICQAAWDWPTDQELILLNYQQKENPLDYLDSTNVVVGK